MRHQGSERNPWWGRNCILLKSLVLITISIWRMRSIISPRTYSVPHNQVLDGLINLNFLRKLSYPSSFLTVS